MELPSMVQRSGDTLIVRSVVSGNPIYMDQSSNALSGNSNLSAPQTNGQVIGVGGVGGGNQSTLILEQQFERLKRAQEHLMQQQQQNIQQEQQRQQAAAMELKEEGLPQCKIKRNYSCSYCTYFTQNPRYHLTHLRDVHGEKIVINKCKLCLYASRHYQKLVRHMKMVHGCTDGIASGHGQARGKRGMNREARKRKLEDSVAVTGSINALSVEAINAEHVKSDMERETQKLQRSIEAFKEHKKQQQLNESIFAVAYEQQLRAQLEYDRESLKANAAAAAAAHSNYEQQQQEQKQLPVQNREDSPPQNKAYDFTPAHHHSNNNNNNNLQTTHQQQQIQISPQRPSFELTPSPSGSNSSPPPLPTGQAQQQQLQQHRATPQALSGSNTPLGSSSTNDEPSNNRLMKCSLCDFTTLYRNHLLEHEIEDHCNAKFYRCEKCSYVTHIKARFSKHVKYHSMPMIKCVTCDFRTPYKWNLDRHMKNHGGAGPFKCAACDFTADIKQSLTVHEMNHHVPPVGHAAGMTLARRRNKVGGTDLNEDFFSDSAEMLEDHFNNNNMDEYDEMLMTAGPIGVFESKRLRFDDEDEPTDLSQKGGSSDTSSVHNSHLSIPKAKKPLPNLIPITKESESILNLTTDLAASRSSLSDIASIFFNKKQISEMLQPMDKSDAVTGAASQLSPTTTSMTSSASSRSLLNRKAGSFFDKIKSSSTTNENLICSCGHMAKCLSESIIHRKTCTFSPLSTHDDMDLDDDEHDEDGEEGRLEIDFAEDDECDKQSHSALNLSVTGSTRCQHCRHRCKSSVDLLNHLKICSEANSRCDSLSGDSCAGSRGMMGDNFGEHPMENRVFVWNKLPRNQQDGNGSQCSEGHHRQQQGSGNSSSNAGGSLLSANNDDNSYYGVETAPGYGEVTKKMTPEEEAANSSLKKVYKCPHCSFWASTASRFHVHIVGHLNKKPFECSLCSYRSNWRWDITKHIRLKTIRDPSHKNARVLMNDETGRRNYTKYNKYITLMKVTEEDGDPKLMKSGEMTPNQVASLAFINDYNNKQQGSTAATPSASNNVNNILNGVREDITLEPIPSKQSAADTNEDQQLSDNLIRLPLLASMMNAAMAQQQHQLNDQDQNATMITPSVTISAVKKSPPSSQNFKPSDEIVLEVRQEGSEKITNYKCRKCNFRHINRDAVLAHVKVHFPDNNQAIVTATANSKSGHQTPLQVTVNPNMNYMNNVLAAMCLSQQQQQQQQQNSNTNTQLSNLVAAGLLEQANNSTLSGLALALAGKSPIKTSHLNAAANFIEHGEQKASLNEASAQNTLTSPNQLTIINQLQPQQQTQATSSSSVTTGVGAPLSTSSLQHLLTSPRRGSFSQTTSSSQLNNDNTNNETMVMGSPFSNNKSGLLAAMSATTPNRIVTTTTTTTTPPTTPKHTYHLITSPFATFNNNNNNNNVANGGDPNMGNGGGDLNDQILITAGVNNVTTAGGDSSNEIVNVPLALSSSSASASQPSCSTSLSLSNSNYIQNQNHSSSSSNNNNNNLGSLSGNGLSNTNNCNNNNNNNNNSNNNNNGIGNGNNNLLTHDTTTAGDRRDPSPYRCGHCHQVSNWKHVIQRHCRLKHAGVINIETLDRTVTTGGDRHIAPIYKPLVNGATNESNNNNTANTQYNLTLKALQQHQHNTNNNNSSTNNNSGLSNNLNNIHQQQKINNSIAKSEASNILQHSPLAASAAAAANAANTPQDLQAAAVAYLAAAYKAAAAQSNNANNTLANLPNLTSMAEELLLQQQLQQNDQIEITRVSSSNNHQQQQQHHHNNNNNNNNSLNISQQAMKNSNLAHLLESSSNSMPSNSNNVISSPQHNAKSKQQKCPLCTYICDSKSQMNYHISLHKPTQYECHMCTFVCAKKQHLSSHMRSVHQMVQNQAVAAAAAANLQSSQNNAVVNMGKNMDFSLALQMTASAKNNQESSSMPTSSLAIDLSSIKHNLPSVSSPSPRNTSAQNQQNYQSQLPPEYQYRMIYYCNKCPARYAQKHSDPLTAKTDLAEHLRQHETPANSEEKRKYHCDYCDYRAIHESIIQTHRFVHTTQYQEKCNELYKNCKEDNVFRAPKLMHITATRKPHNHETIWVVDHDLNEGHPSHKPHHQNSNITSSSQSKTFEAGNSLLKKQLESRQIASSSTLNNEDRNRLQQPEAEDSNTASTSASVATSDLAPENESHHMATPEEETQEKTEQAAKERCQHCPFQSSNTTEFKTHLQQHISVSHQKLAFLCEHCDYTADEQDQIEEHTRVHFNSMEKLKDVAFFTRYDKLELSMEQKAGDENEETTEDSTINIKKELQTQHNNNNEENRVNENFKDSQESARPNMERESNTEMPPKCAKIILYKNDGCLTIKKETNEPQPQTQSQQHQNSITENISDRLRRRISRQGAGVQTLGVTSNSLTSTQLCASSANNEDQPQQSSTSHKTILVNAKTGQVISRN